MTGIQLSLAEPPLAGSTSGGLVLVALAALLLAAVALTRSISALCGLLAGLLSSLFASVGALLLIGLVVVCILVLASAGLGTAAPPPGTLG